MMKPVRIFSYSSRTHLVERVLCLSSLLAGSAMLPQASGQSLAIKPTILYSFPCCNSPISSLASPGKGVLLGTTRIGGAGSGTAFQLLSGPNGETETILYDFVSDINPNGVISIGSGLYGTASRGVRGGPSRYGSIFELTPAGGHGYTQTILYNFAGGADGANPAANLVIGKGGSFFGTTYLGGAYHAGTIFELKPPSSTGGAWTETVLYAFSGAGDGGNPVSTLVIGTNGALFGTTSAFGSPVCKCGTVFQLSPPAVPGGPWTLTTLYTFQGGADGMAPSAGVVMDGNGRLYGTTPYGGAGACPNTPLPGCGTVFQLTPVSGGGAWTETILHTFMGADGANPGSAVVYAPNGAVFGTTPSGGASGLGTVFALTKSGQTWSESRYSFTGQNGDGASPTAGLALVAGSILFGTTDAGGTAGGGTAFQVTF